MHRVFEHLFAVWAKSVMLLKYLQCTEARQNTKQGRKIDVSECMNVNNMQLSHANTCPCDWSNTQIEKLLAVKTGLVKCTCEDENS
jgi:hypothetical protein